MSPASACCLRNLGRVGAVPPGGRRRLSSHGRRHSPDDRQMAEGLGINVYELYQLMRNGEFPTPVAGLWNAGAISTFATTMAAALARWPTLTPDNYAFANWSSLAVSTPGTKGAPSPGGWLAPSQTGIYGSG